ncbi:MAG: YcfA-like protein [Parcubacteria group bacterium GW2011_GWB1_49_7]|nr:MAG: YcfA-like protein [Parcubacteria group bacterium GW2011_GWA1_47_10]KKW09846.1 MAG: YcfA-like protein [Parcubacteria group bacterium GW2011_GWB1_49_7]
MNRAKLILHLLKHGCILLREGSRHSIYKNLITGAQTTVPRKSTLLLFTAKGICKQLGVSWFRK